MDGLQLRWALSRASFDMVARMRAHLDRMMRAISSDGSGLPART